MNTNSAPTHLLPAAPAAGDSGLPTTPSVTATQSSSSSTEDLRCIWGAAVTVLAQGSWPPPRRIPAYLLPRFSMNGSVPIHYADSYRWEQSGMHDMYDNEVCTLPTSLSSRPAYHGADEAM